MTKVIVTAKINFSMSGNNYKPGDKLTVMQDKAEELAARGFIKSMTMPIIDKMIKEAKRRK